jgi:hypothetical protein
MKLRTLTALLAVCILPSVLRAQFPLLPTSFDVGGHPGGPAVADFNGDGRLDFVVPTMEVAGVNGTRNFRLVTYLGDPARPGVFLQPISTTIVFDSALPDAASVFAGDIDGDGKQDVVLRLRTFYTFVKGLGDGRFVNTPPSTGIGGVGGSLPVVLDYNSDGKLDLLFGSGLSLALGNGNGTFQSPTTLETVGTLIANGSNVLLVDVNGDGRADLLNPRAEGFNVRLRLANGSFGPPTAVAAFSGGSSITYLGTGDLNRDGIIDVVALATALAGPTYLYAVLGNGNGNFSTPAQVTVVDTVNTLGGTVIDPNSEPGRGFGVGDFDFDGFPDALVLQNDELGAAPLAKLKFFRGLGDGRFGPGAEVRLASETGALSPSNSIGLSHFLTLFDANGDGAQDVLFSIDGQRSPSVLPGLTYLFLAQPPSVFLSSSANPAVVGSPVKLTANVAAPYNGGQSGGTVRFFINGVAGNQNIPVAGGKAELTTSSLPAGISNIRAGFRSTPDAAEILSPVLPLFVGNAACAQSLAGLTVRPGGFRLDRVTNHFVQDVAITNSTSNPITGPMSIVLAGLSTNATPVNPTGLTSCGSLPAGAHHLDVGLCPNATLPPGATATVTLRFLNPTRREITYQPVITAGLAPR